MTDQNTENALITASLAEPSRLLAPCGAPAPVVVNGGAWVGCSLPSGHAGSHEVTVKWERSTPPAQEGGQ